MMSLCTTTIFLQVSCTRDQNRFIIVFCFFFLFKIAYNSKYSFNLSLNIISARGATITESARGAVATITESARGAVATITESAGQNENEKNIILLINTVLIFPFYK
jgi:hypothetical protein